MRHHAPFTVLLLLLPFMSPAISHQSQEQKAVVTANLNSSFWNATEPGPCTWKGVECTQNSTHLSLHGLNLSNDHVTVEICQLESLQSLDLSNNLLTSIPGVFFTNCSIAKSLKSLNLSMNRLHGSLPFLHGFVSLESLDLSFNSLNGNIGSQLDSLLWIKSLNLSSNHFNGSLPMLLGKNMTLEELNLSHNFFEGAIPEEIFGYRNLRLLDLSSNLLQGSVSDKLGELSKLEALFLSYNNLSGEIPESLSRIRMLSQFGADENQFTGSIPQGISEHVRNFHLSYNRMKGTIPLDLLSGPNLEFVDLSCNLLEGPIPVNLSTSLVRLRLSSNLLRGPIPSSIEKLSNLIYLDLNDNRLTGTVPFELGSCQKLLLLNLGHNLLRGLLPKQLGNLGQLQVMMLDNNQLSGEIPNEISMLKSLIFMSLGRNSLTGAIPSSFENLQNLSYLNLECNELNGSIPDIFSNFKFLLELSVGNNNLSGGIPELPCSLQIALNLSSNHFTGPIPTTLQGLDNLEVLDLSNNGFTGEVPAFLTTLTFLRKLVLSNNQLSGILPLFIPGVTILTDGNVNLKQNPVLISSEGKTKHPTAVIVGAALGGAAVGLGATVAILFFVLRQRRVRGHLITTDSTHFASIDFASAMEAVSNPANIVLKCGYCNYYRAIMPRGDRYFVKELNWDGGIIRVDSCERLRRELETIERLRSPYIMSPLAYVLTTEGAYLFYEYAHKGTVHGFLHQSPVNVLDWPCRYSIALGVAHGLSSLHGCNDPVLLFNLSTKTILLKSLKDPQIADVELYKVVDHSKSTPAVAGSIGYIPPEYVYTMRVTMPGNAYSFGIILLELLTAKPPVIEGTQLANWVLSNSVQNDSLDRVLDPRITEASVNARAQMLTVLKIALSCISTVPEGRPSMKDVVRMLLRAE